MKEPKILSEFKELNGKRILYYENGGCSYGYDDIEIFITENIEILIFYPRVSWEDAELRFLDIDDIKEMIIKYEKFRELLLNQQVIDNEYVNELLDIQKKRKQLKSEQEKQRKLKEYNRLKEELGL